MRPTDAWSRGKLTPPAVRAIGRNARQFERLEAAFESPAVWLHGPPGAGKTTLIANWLVSRRRDPTWLRLDADDSEPASLFFQLGIADALARREPNTRLAVLTPAYQHDVRAFSRRFFRSLFDGERPPIVVLDDYHEIDLNSRVHDCLALGMSEIPPGAHLVVISRAPPPKAFARARINGVLDVIAPEALQVDSAEAREIARTRGLALDAKPIESLVQVTQGWVAGLILMMEAVNRGEPLAANASPRAPELLLDYFTSEVLQKFTPVEQRMLMILSLMPSMTARAAATLAGDSSAGALLERLAQRNDFTVRDAEEERNYRFHPLFRDFLAGRLEREFEPAEKRRVRTLAARVLEECGQPDVAAERLREAAAWDELTNLIHRWARGLESKGRHKTLAAWIDMLPSEWVENNGWTSYWAAMAAAPFAAAASRPMFRRAYRSFTQSGDASGVFLTGAGLLDALASDHFANRDELREVIASLRDFMVCCPSIPSVEIEMRFAVSMYGALNQASADRAAIAHWKARLLATAARTGHPGSIGLARLMVMMQSAVEGDYASVREHAGAIPDPDALTETPDIQALCYLGLIVAQSHRYASGSVVATAEKALNTADRTGVRGYSFIFATYAAGDCIRMGNIDEAAVWVARIGENMDRMASQRAAFYYYCACGLDTLSGNLSSAVKNGKRALELSIASAYCYIEALSRLALSQAYLEMQDLDSVEEQLSGVAKALAASASDSLQFALALSRAEVADRRGGRREGLAALRHAMELGERIGSRRTYLIPPLTTRLLARALANDIAPEFARLLIQNDELAPPGDRVEQWPWPLKIKTLGGFQLFKDGEPLLLSRKIPRRLFTLLKAIAAFGGKDVPQEQIIDAVWKDEDGDAAHQSFDTAIYRLRRLVGDTQILIVRNGRVGFNPSRCWFDAWAFEEGLSAPGASDEEILQSLRLFAGDFLAGENDLPWIQPTRRALRTKFLGTVDVLARERAAKGEWDQAAAVYRMGTEACPHEESPYHGLMRCLHAAGRNDEASRIQNRLRGVLASLRRSPTETGDPAPDGEIEARR